MGDIQTDERHPINLLTLSQCFLTMEKRLSSYPLLRIYIIPEEQFLFVSTQIPKERRDSVVEDYIHKDDRYVQYSGYFLWGIYFHLISWSIEECVNNILRKFVYTFFNRPPSRA